MSVIELASACTGMLVTLPNMVCCSGIYLERSSSLSSVVAVVSLGLRCLLECNVCCVCVQDVERQVHVSKEGHGQ